MQTVSISGKEACKRRRVHTCRVAANASTTFRFKSLLYNALRIIRPDYQADDGFQGFSLRPNYPGRDRSHAYDRQRTDEVRSRNPFVRRRSILRTGNVSSTFHIDHLSSASLTATKPPIVRSIAKCSSSAILFLINLLRFSVRRRVPMGKSRWTSRIEPGCYFFDFSNTYGSEYN